MMIFILKNPAFLAVTNCSNGEQMFSNGDTGFARQPMFSAATRPQKRFITIQVTVKHLETLQQMVLLLNYC